ncbi:MAG: hypothetical protein ACOX2G_11740 [Bacillota bacterium]
MSTHTFRSLGYLIGQIASGFFLVGDIRDAVSNLALLNFKGVLISLLGFVPLLGDATKISDGLISFMKRAPECIQLAARLIITKLDDWKAIRNTLLDAVLPFICKNSDEAVTILKRAGATSELIVELGRHNDAAKIAKLVDAGDEAGKIFKFDTAKLLRKADVDEAVEKYIKALDKPYKEAFLKQLRAERFAVESAKDYFTKQGYNLLYDARHGVNGPDMILKKGDDILIIEAKGALKAQQQILH